MRDARLGLLSGGRRVVVVGETRRAHPKLRLTASCMYCTCSGQSYVVLGEAMVRVLSPAMLHGLMDVQGDNPQSCLPCPHPHVVLGITTNEDVRDRTVDTVAI